MLDVPVALFSFNRPKETARVLEAIAKVRPKRLFLISDGPRVGRPEDEISVREVQQVLSRVEWDCVIHREHSSVNLGCKVRVSSGLDMVFEKVEEAIILEDDCVPAPAFFSYCSQMLARYRPDARVFSISGSQFGQDERLGHYFSKYALMWGWATWRDRWLQYRVDPQDFRRVLLRTWAARPVALMYWWKIFSDVQAGRINTWDYQWLLTVWRHRAVACRPSVNLVQNIGFGPSATHTTYEANKLAKVLAEDVDDLSAPLTEVEADAVRDRVDEEVWAFVNMRSVLLMHFPWLSRIRRRSK